jgi:hypothetical protein
MLAHYVTFQTGKQVEKTHQRPIEFLCVAADKSLETVWAKYPFQWNQFDCLVYELVCAKLLRALGLSTPETGLVTVKHDPKPNLAIYADEPVAFASIEVKAKPLAEEDIESGRAWKKLIKKPDHLIGIILFDFWVANADRSRGNYNLLLAENGLLHPFDHFDCFGGNSKIGQFEADLWLDPQMATTLRRSKLFDTLLPKLTFKSVEDWLGRIEQTIRNENKIRSILGDIFKDLPESWATSADLNVRLERFLLNMERFQRVKNLAELNFRKALS